MIVMPAMSNAQTAAWHSLMDLYETLNQGWTLIGGQMVHLHCAEHNYAPPRPTDDADTVIDVRAEQGLLAKFTATLADLGFRADGISAEGRQHRWVRDTDQAQIDVLLPDGLSEAAENRPGINGAPTIPTPGGTQALHRTKAVEVQVGGRSGSVLRPNLVGALIMKAAAHSTTDGHGAKGRHRLDFLCLAGLIAARDFKREELSKKDRKRLRDMIAATRSDANLLAQVEDATATLNRMERAIAN